MEKNMVKDVLHISLTPRDGAQGLLQAVEECRGISAEIHLSAGDYFMEKTVVLGPEYQNLCIKGEGKVRLIGGKRLSGWRKISDKAVLPRLDKGMEEHVLVCDLSANGVEETGHFSRRGYGGDLVPSHAEIFLDGVPMTVSQYPKKGEFLHVTGYERELVNECEEKIGHPDHAFFYNDSRPRAWAENDDLWVHGYWCWDWANSYEGVRTLDKENCSILLEPIPNHRVRGYKPGQRFYFLNILEEVNTPGDYYIDRKNNLLYFYPPALSEDSELLISMMETPIFQMRGCENITLCGLQLECVRGDAVVGAETNDFVVDRCSFRNIGNYAVVMEEGRRNIVKNSTIHDCGDGGIKLRGGDRMTLEHADSAAINNHIYRVASWSRCYQPAVKADGVGISIRHNLIHDCPHNAILWGGNDIIIEDNEIYSVVMETGDAGAIYAGQDITFRGNHVSHNYIHHLGGVGMGTMGIYNDDVLSGTIMENNFFYEVGRAVMLGGGMDYVVKNNVFVKCYPAGAMDSRASHTEFFWWPCYEQQRKNLYNARQSFQKPNDPDIVLDCTKSPYIEKYPELAKVAKVYETGVQLTASAEITRNIFCSKPLFRYYFDPRDANVEHIYDCGEPVTLTDSEKSEIFDTRHDFRATWSPGKGDWRFAKNFTASPKDFEDAEWGLISVRPESKAFVYGYEGEGFDSIGLIREEREETPSRVLTCLTYPYNKEEKPLTLGLRNMEDVEVSGTIELYTSNPEIRLDQKKVSFTLAPHEERYIPVGDVSGQERFTVDARSDVPGVRPCRAENFLGNWNRF